MINFRESYYLERLEPIKKAEESDDKYNEKHERWRELCENSYSTAELIIAKQRHGPIGTIKTHFDSNFTKFSNFSNIDYNNVSE